ncbi:MAG TPA: DUF1622 domain-containing protein [Candidatus Absconditabacterales bacterium]|nr:DUF1622 domain-containing protein [Candidatus Absconditabacterales bacterium]
MLNHGLSLFWNYAENILKIITTIIYISGILVIIIGFVKAAFKFIKSFFIKKLNSHNHQNKIRVLLGVYILLGLDFIIIADIIHSIMSTEIQQLYALGMIVIIRIAIAYFLGKEIKEIEK